MTSPNCSIVFIAMPLTLTEAPDEAQRAIMPAARRMLTSKKPKNGDEIIWLLNASPTTIIVPG
ncbi:MAG: hypothetical protein IPF82_14655 [Blastocatellia bacterium]|nr:hypothetical protein [Blastocatellia bacterium]